VQIAFRQSQIFAKRAGMVDDAENGAPRAMPAEAAPAPVAPAAGQVDLANDAAANPRGRIRLDHLADELVAGRAGEAVVTALEFQSVLQMPPQSRRMRAKPRAGAGRAGGLGAFRWFVAYFDASVFQVYG
jgi:hypothetical protein